MSVLTPTLASFTTIRLGGPAKRLVVTETDDDVVAAVREAEEQGQPVLLLGGGSNLIVSDAGYSGTVVHVSTTGVTYREKGERVLVEAAAGHCWDDLVAECVHRGLAGIECLSGIPGSVGATPIQNVGAYGQEIADVLDGVAVYDRLHGRYERLNVEQCEFGYRSSVFKRHPHRWVVLRVTYSLRRGGRSAPIRYSELARSMELREGESAPIATVRDAILQLRRSKGMVLDSADPDTASAGSFFTNPFVSSNLVEEIARRTDGQGMPQFPQADGTVKLSAAWLIQHAGFTRGYGNQDGIAISSKHVLALTNRGNGTAADLVDLARSIAEGVRDKFGVELVPEPVFVGLPWP